MAWAAVHTRIRRQCPGGSPASGGAFAPFPGSKSRIHDEQSEPGVLPVFGLLISRIRHTRIAPTSTQSCESGGGMERHHHRHRPRLWAGDDHRVRPHLRPDDGHHLGALRRHAQAAGDMAELCARTRPVPSRPYRGSLGVGRCTARPSCGHGNATPGICLTRPGSPPTGLSRSTHGARPRTTPHYKRHRPISDIRRFWGRCYGDPLTVEQVVHLVLGELACLVHRPS